MRIIILLGIVLPISTFSQNWHPANDTLWEVVFEEEFETSNYFSSQFPID